MSQLNGQTRQLPTTLNGIHRPAGAREPSSIACEAAVVAVIAPRRSGKSTLVEYLVREARPSTWRSAGVVVDAFASSGGFDTSVSGARLACLSKLLGHRWDGTDGISSDGDAFDDLRRSARKRATRQWCCCSMRRSSFPIANVRENQFDDQDAPRTTLGESNERNGPLLLGFAELLIDAPAYRR